MGWEAPEGQRPPVALYLVPLITCVVSTVAVAMPAEATNTDSFGEAIVLGVVAGLGLAGVALLVTGFFDPTKPQPMVWVAVTGGYHLVGLLAVAVIVGLWR